MPVSRTGYITSTLSELTSRSVLGTRNALGGYDVKRVSRRHNASNEVEADRVRASRLL